MKLGLRLAILYFGLGPVLLVSGLIALVAVFIVPLSFTPGGFQTAPVAAAAQPGVAAPSEEAVADIPTNYLALYQKWGKEYGVAWELGAGIGKEETNHGRLKAPGVTDGINFIDCCRGPHQFHTEYGNGAIVTVNEPGCPPYTYRKDSTWDAFKVDGDKDGVFCVFDPEDSIPSMFNKLAQNGATDRASWESAVFKYNRSRKYVNDVIANATEYAQAVIQPVAEVAIARLVPSAGLATPPNLGAPNAMGYYRLPPSTNGAYRIYSGECRQYGSLELIQVIYTVAQRWKELYPDGYLWIGDLNGGYPHRTHKWGVAVDLDATTNGRDWAGDFTKGNYNEPATIVLGKLFIDTDKTLNIWYNDEDVNAAVRAYAKETGLSLRSMKWVKGHDNHFHLDTTTPRGPSNPACDRNPSRPPG